MRSQKTIGCIKEVLIGGKIRMSLLLALLQRVCVRAVMDTGCRAGGGVWKAVLAA